MNLLLSVVFWISSGTAGIFATLFYVIIRSVQKFSAFFYRKSLFLFQMQNGYNWYLKNSLPVWPIENYK